jgi:hypothetical protein
MEPVENSVWPNNHVWAIITYAIQWRSGILVHNGPSIVINRARNREGLLPTTAT